MTCSNDKHKKVVLVQERDRNLLRELSIMRVVTREQAKIVAGFGSTTRVNTRLLALTRAGLLKRFFMGRAQGWKTSLYLLSPLGANLVQATRRGPKRRRDEVMTFDSFVLHQLCINDIYCRLKYQPIPIEGTKFVRWESFSTPVDSQHPLIPDGYAEIATPTRNLPAFLEVDLGNEGLTTWKDKVRKYIRYIVVGDVERTFHEPGFRVLVVTNSDQRREELRKATAAITDKVFWFTTTDSIQRDGFWSSIWFRPRGDHEPISLL